MKRIPMIALLLLCAADPSRAELNAYYRGVDRMSGDETPATAQLSIEAGRVALVIKGSHGCRMLFLKKDETLRFVDDAEKTYVDMEKSWLGSGAEGEAEMTASLEQELAQLPPDQRDAARALVEESLGSAKAPPAPEYVRTKEKSKVLGYDCTKVEVMRGGDKRGEYWGTASKDFHMSDAERTTMLAMQEYLRRLASLVAPAGVEAGPAGAFDWDLSVDGFPLITRCFEKNTMTLDLKAASFDRKALSKDLFEIPSDYKELSIPAPEK
jgi:uncharacterized protein DUF4412